MDSAVLDRLRVGAVRPSHTSSVVGSPSAVHSENWVYTLKGADGLPYKMVARKEQKKTTRKALMRCFVTEFEKQVPFCPANRLESLLSS